MPLDLSIDQLLTWVIASCASAIVIGEFVFLHWLQFWNCNDVWVIMSWEPTKSLSGEVGGIVSITEGFWKCVELLKMIGIIKCYLRVVYTFIPVAPVFMAC